MYAFIRGTLFDVQPSYAVIEAGGIGFKIHIPATTYTRLDEVGKPALLHTTFVVREYSQGLYGFFLAEERDLFDLLIEISGVGPKMGLNLIGHLSLGDLHQIILQEDLTQLCKVPGVGKKTAERLLIELRNKSETLLGKMPEHSSVNKPADPQHQKMQDAIKALVHLGYNHSKAQQAIRKTLDPSKDLDLSSLIATALKHV